MASPMRPAMQRDLVAAVIRTVKRGTVGVDRALAGLAAGLQQDLGALGDVQKAHNRVAGRMREAVQARYEETVESRKRVPSYRYGQGRLPGALGAALRKPSMVQATGRGIEYVDVDSLDKEARHWRRLNFGAGSAATTDPATVPLRIADRVVANLRLPGGPRAPILLPPGFFMHGDRAVPRMSSFRGNSQHPFFPSGRPAMFETAGITGRQFLDAGVQSLARELPGEYEQLLDKWLRSATKRGQAAANAIRR